MRQHTRGTVALFGIGGLGLVVGCGARTLTGGGGSAPVEGEWGALMDDGDVAQVAPAAAAAAAPAPAPPRTCADCAATPLAFWSFDDCNAASTELADSAFGGATSHPAFRAVSVACAAGRDGQAVQLAGGEDVVYAPDQPDFQFGQGLTVAAWINPARITGTQSIVRKRLDASSSFVLAIARGRLQAVVRLAGGRLLGASTAVQAGRFTHVAVTYDGQQLLLYTDGAVAAQARGAGTIAAGAGPIFIGNDADGRAFAGLVDSVWLNTLAAPADVIKGLTCVRTAPALALSPSSSAPQVAGATVPFDLAVTNQSDAACPADLFELFASNVFAPLTTDTPFATPTIAPGQTAHVPVNITSARSAVAGSYTFQYEAFDTAAFQLPPAFATATYVVGTGPVACDGVPPASPVIVGAGAPPFEVGAPFTFVAAGLQSPVATPVLGPDGSTQALQVIANPGPATDPAQAFMGVGLPFASPACIDARAFTGVRFTITGDLGTCFAQFSAIPSEDNSVANGPVGACTASVCVPPFAGPITTGTTVVHFSDMTGGQPLDGVDASAVNDIQWTLTAPTDGVTAPCVANFTISDVSFVTD